MIVQKGLRMLECEQLVLILMEKKALTHTYSHPHTLANTYLCTDTHTHTVLVPDSGGKGHCTTGRKAYNSFNPALRCDSPLSGQMSEKSTAPGREAGRVRAAERREERGQREGRGAGGSRRIEGNSRK